MQLKFRRLPGLFAICQLPANQALPSWAHGEPFTSITSTRDELSIVCPEQNIPADIKADRGWICLKLEGPFPFTQTGVLSSFIAPLSGNAIPIFAISTYDTDYVLIKEAFQDAGLGFLQAAGHQHLEDK